MPITSPGNDDDTGENHQPTLRKNTAEPVEQTLKQNTWDNGTESSCHLLVDEALGMLTYHADPYSSYQRGTNENRNGRIRRYLPKKTSFDGLTDEDLQAIVDEINDTPMKVLDWETPNEVWYRELGKVLSKTSHPKTSVALTN